MLGVNSSSYLTNCCGNYYTINRITALVAFLLFVSAGLSYSFNLDVDTVYLLAGVGAAFAIISFVSFFFERSYIEARIPRLKEAPTLKVSPLDSNIRTLGQSPSEHSFFRLSENFQLEGQDYSNHIIIKYTICADGIVSHDFLLLQPKMDGTWHARRDSQEESIGQQVHVMLDHLFFDNCADWQNFINGKDIKLSKNASSTSGYIYLKLGYISDEEMRRKASS